MKYNNCFLHFSFYFLLFYNVLFSAEYVFHKQIIKEKDYEKEKIFKNIREKLDLNEDKFSIYSFAYENKRDKKGNGEEVSSSLKQKINLKRIFDLNKKNIFFDEKFFTEKDNKIKSINLDFIINQKKRLQNNFQERFPELSFGSIVFQIINFLVLYFLEKGISFEESFTYSEDIVKQSPLFEFLNQHDNFSIIDYLLEIQKKYLDTNKKNIFYNNACSKLLEKIIIFDLHSKIERERALNQFYNMSNRRNEIVIFSFYNNEKLFSIYAAEPYGNLHVSKDIYKYFLIEPNEKGSQIRKRSLLNLGKINQQLGFLMMPRIKSNIVNYFAPLYENLSIENYFRKNILKNKDNKLCSIIFLDKDDIKFLLK